MGQTCSSCCWNDRRASDVLEGEDARALQEKLLDVSDYNDLDGNNGTMLTDDSRRNPYSHSGSRMKDSWPRPAATPTSGYGGYEDDDDDDDGGSVSRSGYGNGSDTDEQDDSERSSSGARRSPMGTNTWNLNETGGSAGTSFDTSNPMDRDEDEDDDDADTNRDSQAGIGPALRHDRVLSATQSVRSTTSDSYASIRELSTYESLLFADDAAAQNSASTGKGEDNDDGNDNDEDEDDQGDRNSMSSSGQPSTSSSCLDSSSVIEGSGGGGAIHRKRSY